MATIRVAFFCLLGPLAGSTPTSMAPWPTPTAGALSPQEAERWASELVQEFALHPITSHPLMNSLARAAYPDHASAVAHFAHQVYAFARDFRAVCGICIGKLKCCDEVRDNLIYHLAEENGRYPDEDVAFLATKNISAASIVGKPHIDLWAALLHKLRVSTRSGFIPEAEELDQWMLDHVRAHSATSSAAMIMGIELWSKDMGKDMIPALAKAGIPAEDAIFFHLHNVIDDEVHVADIGKDLVSLLTQQTPENTLVELKGHMWEFQDMRMKLWNTLHNQYVHTPKKPSVAVA